LKGVFAWQVIMLIAPHEQETGIARIESVAVDSPSPPY
jgi:hypothetical protein